MVIGSTILRILPEECRCCRNEEFLGKNTYIGFERKGERPENQEWLRKASS
jgi:hypothetical protein